jgi:hypothetical protein
MLEIIFLLEITSVCFGFYLFENFNLLGYEEGMSLGYSISQGRFIVVGMPYIAADNFNYCAIWWDNTAATVQYAKVNVPRILKKYGGDATRVLLTGFSRGAIAVSYIGLYDDEIAKLWTAFYAHEHFDGNKILCKLITS